MTLRASKETLKRAEIKNNQWHTPLHRPNYSPDANEISVTVLMYSKKDDLHALGWFNFDQDKWNAFQDYDFDVDEPFVWMYPPKP